MKTRSHPGHADEWSTVAHWHRLVVAVGITALMGCGNSPPDHPVSSHTSGSADAVASPPASATASASPAATEPARPAPTQMSPLGPIAQQAPKLGAFITDDPRAASPAHDARLQTAASPADEPQLDEQATAERAQREARQRWFEEVREHPDVTVRLQALELWAQQPGDALDPVTYSLVDEDEQVRARAQELWEQQLTQEAAETVPFQEEGPGEQAER